MKPASECTVLVVDHGLFLPFAQRLQFQRVLYWSPWEQGFPLFNRCVIGDGYPKIERIDDVWDYRDEIDLAIFPDIQHHGMQQVLAEQGIPVWGSRSADRLEISREYFLRTLRELGMDTPRYKVVRGLTALREYLADEEDRYIKLSKFRGSMETWHWRNAKLDTGKLDALAVKFGPAREQIPFVVLNPIAANFETGCDTYCIDGHLPKVRLVGQELKDHAYFGALRAVEDMPAEVETVNQAFAPILKQYGYRNFWSTEIRVNDQGVYFIDPTCRMPSPAGESQVALYHNLTDLIWAGAQGELLEPEITDTVAVQAVLTTKAEKGAWQVAEFPKSLRPHLYCGSSCCVDGLTCFPPDDQQGEEIGWLVATGDNPKAAVAKLVELAGELPPGVHADLAAVAELMQEVEAAQEAGVELTEDKLPEPNDIL